MNRSIICNYNQLVLVNTVIKISMLLFYMNIVDNEQSVNK